MDCVEMFTRKPSASHNEQPNQTENRGAYAGLFAIMHRRKSSAGHSPGLLGRPAIR